MRQLSQYETDRRDLLRRVAIFCTRPSAEAEGACANCRARRCHHCGTRAPSWLALEVDHLDGKGWVASKVNSQQRLRIMARELEAGARLALSCGYCNKSKSAQIRYRWAVQRKRAKGGKGYTSWAVGYVKHCLEEKEKADEQAT